LAFSRWLRVTYAAGRAGTAVAVAGAAVAVAGRHVDGLVGVREFERNFEVASRRFDIRADRLLLANLVTREKSSLVQGNRHIYTRSCCI
jgi:hypothetical protein